MQVNEAKKRKAELERSILSAMEDFESITGCMIVDIRIRTTATEQTRRSYVATVNVSAELP